MRKFTGLNCILLVDDDIATNYINSLVIRNAEIDAEIKILETAKSALEFLTCSGDYSDIAEPPCPGLILLDINMPVMSGWDFMDEYEKLPAEQKAKYVVVMLSSSLNRDDMEKASNNKDIAAFLHKPLEEKDILSLVQKLFTEVV
jgi:CheY-like chemotaxis protein